MSRGFGVVQRTLLTRVEETWTELRPELWLCVTTVDLGLGEHRESRRRAAHGLAAAGRIELRAAEVPVQCRGEHQAIRRLLFARLPVSADDLNDAAELRARARRTQTRMWDAIAAGPEYKRLHAWMRWYDAHYWSDENIFDLDGDDSY
ncbi:hypothetical protein [Nocardioides sp. zg-1228]|uniref:hypothetical protein n=1 Tax=Nocardioides sp. zg-1228 TaxID=2763008 RepID=UPI00164266DB|nr:hypothetical protein [Nocardioides sp. zg-1228]MBC2934703.1 hypothetical protein [Nocardioides sp. zg-1228]QSF56021.1 hypothetical protein JX575_09970 [Nocardioides sp. zg-1228]